MNFGVNGDDDYDFGFFTESVVDASVQDFMTHDQLPPVFQDIIPASFARLDPDRVLAMGPEYAPYTYIIDLATKQYIAAPNRTTDSTSRLISLTNGG